MRYVVKTVFALSLAVITATLPFSPVLADYDDDITVKIALPGGALVLSGEPAGACIVAPSPTFPVTITVTADRPIAALSMSVLFGTDLPVWQIVPFGQDQDFTVQSSAGDTIVTFNPPRRADPWHLTTYFIAGPGRDPGAISYLFSVIDDQGFQSREAALAIGRIAADCR